MLLYSPGDHSRGYELRRERRMVRQQSGLGLPDPGFDQRHHDFHIDLQLGFRLRHRELDAADHQHQWLFPDQPCTLQRGLWQQQHGAQQDLDRQ